jgi:hypothetical protein
MLGMESDIEQYVTKPEDMALLVAVEANLVKFIRQVVDLRQHVSRRRPQRYPLLYHAICRPVLAPMLKSIISLKYPERGKSNFVDTICWLLDSGRNPNEEFSCLEATTTSLYQWLTSERITDKT